MSETITLTLRGPINDGKQIVIERDLLPDRVGDWDDSGMGVHWYKIELDENGEPTGFADYDKSQWIIGTGKPTRVLRDE